MPSDRLLEIIVLSANTVANGTDGRSEYGITIIVGGVVVSGTIITATEYRLHHPLLAAIDDLAGGLKKKVEGASHLDFATVFGSDFIHLKNAIFDGAAPHQNTSQSSPFFRARLSDVSGFSLHEI